MMPMMNQQQSNKVKISRSELWNQKRAKFLEQHGGSSSSSTSNNHVAPATAPPQHQQGEQFGNGDMIRNLAAQEVVYPPMDHRGPPMDHHAPPAPPQAPQKSELDVLHELGDRKFGKGKRTTRPGQQVQQVHEHQGNPNQRGAGGGGPFGSVVPGIAINGNSASEQHRQHQHIYPEREDHEDDEYRRKPSRDRAAGQRRGNQDQNYDQDRTPPPPRRDLDQEGQQLHRDEQKMKKPSRTPQQPPVSARGGGGLLDLGATYEQKKLALRKQQQAEMRAEMQERQKSTGKQQGPGPGAHLRKKHRQLSHSPERTPRGAWSPVGNRSNASISNSAAFSPDNQDQYFDGGGGGRGRQRHLQENRNAYYKNENDERDDARRNTSNNKQHHQKRSHYTTGGGQHRHQEDPRSPNNLDHGDEDDADDFAGGNMFDVLGQKQKAKEEKLRRQQREEMRRAMRAESEASPLKSARSRNRMKQERARQKNKDDGFFDNLGDAARERHERALREQRKDFQQWVRDEGNQRGSRSPPRSPELWRDRGKSVEEDELVGGGNLAIGGEDADSKKRRELQKHRMEKYARELSEQQDAIARRKEREKRQKGEPEWWEKRQGGAPAGAVGPITSPEKSARERRRQVDVDYGEELQQQIADKQKRLAEEERRRKQPEWWEQGGAGGAGLGNIGGGGKGGDDGRGAGRGRSGRARVNLDVPPESLQHNRSVSPEVSRNISTPPLHQATALQPAFVYGDTDVGSAPGGRGFPPGPNQDSSTSQSTGSAFDKVKAAPPPAAFGSMDRGSGAKQDRAAMLEARRNRRLGGPPGQLADSSSMSNQPTSSGPAQPLPVHHETSFLGGGDEGETMGNEQLVPSYNDTMDNPYIRVRNNDLLWGDPPFVSTFGAPGTGGGGLLLNNNNVGDAVDPLSSAASPMSPTGPEDGSTSGASPPGGSSDPRFTNINVNQPAPSPTNITIQQGGGAAAAKGCSSSGSGQRGGDDKNKAFLEKIFTDQQKCANDLLSEQTRMFANQMQKECERLRDEKEDALKDLFEMKDKLLLQKERELRLMENQLRLQRGEPPLPLPVEVVAGGGGGGLQPRQSGELQDPVTTAVSHLPRRTGSRSPERPRIYSSHLELPEFEGVTRRSGEAFSPSADKGQKLLDSGLLEDSSGRGGAVVRSSTVVRDPGGGVAQTPDFDGASGVVGSSSIIGKPIVPNNMNNMLLNNSAGQLLPDPSGGDYRPITPAVRQSLQFDESLGSHMEASMKAESKLVRPNENYPPLLGETFVGAGGGTGGPVGGATDNSGPSNVLPGASLFLEGRGPASGRLGGVVGASPSMQTKDASRESIVRGSAVAEAEQGGTIAPGFLASSEAGDASPVQIVAGARNRTSIDLTSRGDPLLAASTRSSLGNNINVPQQLMDSRTGLPVVLESLQRSADDFISADGRRLSVADLLRDGGEVLDTEGRHIPVEAAPVDVVVGPRAIATASTDTSGGDMFFEDINGNVVAARNLRINNDGFFVAARTGGPVHGAELSRWGGEVLDLHGRPRKIKGREQTSYADDEGRGVPLAVLQRSGTDFVSAFSEAPISARDLKRTGGLVLDVKGDAVQVRPIALSAAGTFEEERGVPLDPHKRSSTTFGLAPLANASEVTAALQNDPSVLDLRFVDTKTKAVIKPETLLLNRGVASSSRVDAAVFSGEPTSPTLAASSNDEKGKLTATAVDGTSVPLAELSLYGGTVRSVDPSRPNVAVAGEVKAWPIFTSNDASEQPASINPLGANSLQRLGSHFVGTDGSHVSGDDLVEFGGDVLKTDGTSVTIAPVDAITRASIDVEQGGEFSTLLKRANEIVAARAASKTSAVEARGGIKDPSSSITQHPTSILDVLAPEDLTSLKRRGTDFVAPDGSSVPASLLAAFGGEVASRRTEGTPNPKPIQARPPKRLNPDGKSKRAKLKTVDGYSIPLEELARRGADLVAIDGSACPVVEVLAFGGAVLDTAGDAVTLVADPTQIPAEVTTTSCILDEKSRSRGPSASSLPSPSSARYQVPSAIVLAAESQLEDAVTARPIALTELARVGPNFVSAFGRSVVSAAELLQYGGEVLDTDGKPVLVKAVRPVQHRKKITTSSSGIVVDQPQATALIMLKIEDCDFRLLQHERVEVPLAQLQRRGTGFVAADGTGASVPAAGVARFGGALLDTEGRTVLALPSRTGTEHGLDEDGTTLRKFSFANRPLRRLSNGKPVAVETLQRAGADFIAADGSRVPPADLAAFGGQVLDEAGSVVEVLSSQEDLDELLEGEDDDHDSDHEGGPRRIDSKSSRGTVESSLMDTGGEGMGIFSATSKLRRKPRNTSSKVPHSKPEVELIDARTGEALPFRSLQRSGAGFVAADGTFVATRDLARFGGEVLDVGGRKVRLQASAADFMKQSATVTKSPSTEQQVVVPIASLKRVGADFVSVDGKRVGGADLVEFGGEVLVDKPMPGEATSFVVRPAGRAADAPVFQIVVRGDEPRSATQPSGAQTSSKNKTKLLSLQDLQRSGPDFVAPVSKDAISAKDLIRFGGEVLTLESESVLVKPLTGIAELPNNFSSISPTTNKKVKIPIQNLVRIGTDFVASDGTRVSPQELLRCGGEVLAYSESSTADAAAEVGGKTEITKTLAPPERPRGRARTTTSSPVTLLPQTTAIQRERLERLLVDAATGKDFVPFGSLKRLGTAFVARDGRAVPFEDVVAFGGELQTTKDSTTSGVGTDNVGAGVGHGDGPAHVIRVKPSRSRETSQVSHLLPIPEDLPLEFESSEDDEEHQHPPDDEEKSEELVQEPSSIHLEDAPLSGTRDVLQGPLSRNKSREDKKKKKTTSTSSTKSTSSSIPVSSLKRDGTDFVAVDGSRVDPRELFRYGGEVLEVDGKTVLKVAPVLGVQASTGVQHLPGGGKKGAHQPPKMDSAFFIVDDDTTTRSSANSKGPASPISSSKLKVRPFAFRALQRRGADFVASDGKSPVSGRDLERFGGVVLAVDGKRITVLPRMLEAEFQTSGATTTTPSTGEEGSTRTDLLPALNLKTSALSEAALVLPHLRRRSKTGIDFIAIDGSTVPAASLFKYGGEVVDVAGRRVSVPPLMTSSTGAGRSFPQASEDGTGTGSGREISAMNLQRIGADFVRLDGSRIAPAELIAVGGTVVDVDGHPVQISPRNFGVDQSSDVLSLDQQKDRETEKKLSVLRRLQRQGNDLVLAGRGRSGVETKEATSIVPILEVEVRRKGGSVLLDDGRVVTFVTPEERGLRRSRTGSSSSASKAFVMDAADLDELLVVNKDVPRAPKTKTTSRSTFFVDVSGKRIPTKELQKADSLGVDLLSPTGRRISPERAAQVGGRVLDVNDNIVSLQPQGSGKIEAGSGGDDPLYDAQTGRLVPPRTLQRDPVSGDFVDEYGRTIPPRVLAQRGGTVLDISGRNKVTLRPRENEEVFVLKDGGKIPKSNLQRWTGGGKEESRAKERGEELQQSSSSTPRPQKVLPPFIDVRGRPVSIASVAERGGEVLDRNGAAVLIQRAARYDGDFVTVDGKLISTKDLVYGLEDHVGEGGSSSDRGRWHRDRPSSASSSRSQKPTAASLKRLATKGGKVEMKLQPLLKASSSSSSTSTTVTPTSRRRKSLETAPVEVLHILREEGRQTFVDASTGAPISTRELKRDGTAFVDAEGQPISSTEIIRKLQKGGAGDRAGVSIAGGAGGGVQLLRADGPGAAKGSGPNIITVQLNRKSVQQQPPTNSSSTGATATSPAPVVPFTSKSWNDDAIFTDVFGRAVSVRDLARERIGSLTYFMRPLDEIAREDAALSSASEDGLDLGGKDPSAASSPSTRANNELKRRRRSSLIQQTYGVVDIARLEDGRRDLVLVEELAKNGGIVLDKMGKPRLLAKQLDYMFQKPPVSSTRNVDRGTGTSSSAASVGPSSARLQTPNMTTSRSTGGGGGGGVSSATRNIGEVVFPPTITPARPRDPSRSEHTMEYSLAGRSKFLPPGAYEHRTISPMYSPMLPTGVSLADLDQSQLAQNDVIDPSSLHPRRPPFDRYPGGGKIFLRASGGATSSPTSAQVGEDNFNEKKFIPLPEQLYVRDARGNFARVPQRTFSRLSVSGSYVEDPAGAYVQKSASSAGTGSGPSSNSVTQTSFYARLPEILYFKRGAPDGSCRDLTTTSATSAFEPIPDVVYVRDENKTGKFTPIRLGKEAQSHQASRTGSKSITPAPLATASTTTLTVARPPDGTFLRDEKTETYFPAPKEIFYRDAQTGSVKAVPTETFARHDDGVFRRDVCGPYTRANNNTTSTSSSNYFHKLPDTLFYKKRGASGVEYFEELPWTFYKRKADGNYVPEARRRKDPVAASASSGNARTSRSSMLQPAGSFSSSTTRLQTVEEQAAEIDAEQDSLNIVKRDQGIGSAPRAVHPAAAATPSVGVSFSLQDQPQRSASSSSSLLIQQQPPPLVLPFVQSVPPPNAYTRNRDGTYSRLPDDRYVKTSEDDGHFEKITPEKLISLSTPPSGSDSKSNLKITGSIFFPISTASAVDVFAKSKNGSFLRIPDDTYSRSASGGGGFVRNASTRVWKNPSRKQIQEVPSASTSIVVDLDEAEFLLPAMLEDNDAKENTKIVVVNEERDVDAPVVDPVVKTRTSKVDKENEHQSQSQPSSSSRSPSASRTPRSREQKRRMDRMLREKSSTLDELMGGGTNTCSSFASTSDADSFVEGLMYNVASAKSTVLKRGGSGGITSKRGTSRDTAGQQNNRQSVVEDDLDVADWLSDTASSVASSGAGASTRRRSRTKNLLKNKDQTPATSSKNDIEEAPAGPSKPNRSSSRPLSGVSSSSSQIVCGGGTFAGSLQRLEKAVDALRSMKRAEASSSVQLRHGQKPSKGTSEQVENEFSHMRASDESFFDPFSEYKGTVDETTEKRAAMDLAAENSPLSQLLKETKQELSSIRPDLGTTSRPRPAARGGDRPAENYTSTSPLSKLLTLDNAQVARSSVQILSYPDRQRGVEWSGHPHPPSTSSIKPTPAIVHTSQHLQQHSSNLSSLTDAPPSVRDTVLPQLRQQVLEAEGLSEDIRTQLLDIFRPPEQLHSTKPSASAGAATTRNIGIGGVASPPSTTGTGGGAFGGTRGRSSFGRGPFS
ncbi:unnamed protein product [Amoebophrya sp. A25]|nr:unnamed protein product [Amoebophrya sp. A25]|eukprot:GSA25T00007121001.1